MRRSRGEAGARLAFATDRQLQQLAPRSTSLTSINRQVSDVLEEPKALGLLNQSSVTAASNFAHDSGALPPGLPTAFPASATGISFV
jgi:hypothetical protein